MLITHDLFLPYLHDFVPDDLFVQLSETPGVEIIDNGMSGFCYYWHWWTARFFDGSEIDFYTD